MKLFVHYCPHGFSNCYIAGTEHDAADREALIIDPGIMDAEVLNFIEKNEYKLRGVLITHDHSHHVRGLRTLKKIYNTDIYAVNPTIRNHRTILVRDGDTVSIGSFRVQVISIPGHSADSAVYKLDHLLFTGDALSAGMVGNTDSSYAATTQLSALRSRLLSLPGDYTVLPGHGPPSSLEAERHFNAGLISAAERKTSRPNYSLFDD
ncbi:hypothetical protein AGMMS49928_08690 [Spirochaetia bacterium]|nr:hypothetical protein AGMMS49928_08690 [Spirochaetia bacterium]